MDHERIGSWRESRRPDSAYRRRLLVSIGASVLLNLLFLWIIFKAGSVQSLWLNRKPGIKPVREVPQLVLMERPPARPVTPPPERQKQIFIETDPNQASQEKPKDAGHYSQHNTQATQTTPSEIKDGETPKMDGANTKTHATESVQPGRPAPPPMPPAANPARAQPPRPPSPPQPAKPPQPEQPKSPQAEQPNPVKPEPPKPEPPKPEPPKVETPKPAPTTEKNVPPPIPQPPPKPNVQPAKTEPPKIAVEPPKTGDYALLRPTAQPIVKSAHEETAPPPPETVRESPPAAPRITPSPPNMAVMPVAPALPRPQPTAVPSQPSSDRDVLAAKSKLDGGVRRIGKPAFNSEESPFATYDKKIIQKVASYWHYLVDNKFYGEKVGEVELSFKLLSNGRISELHIDRNSANTVLAGWCLQAIEQSAPFDPFPPSMKALVGDSRDASITFAY